MYKPILRLTLPFTFPLVPGLLAATPAPAFQSDQPLVARLAGQYGEGAFVLSLDGGALRISHATEPARTLWTSVPGCAFLGAAQGQADIRQFGTPDGSYRIDVSCLNSAIKLPRYEPNHMHRCQRACSSRLRRVRFLLVPADMRQT